jgi:hypothetical protein
MMRLCFLMERQYAAYIKWFGTAFQQLTCAEHLTPIFHRALDVANWQEREQQMTAAYEYLITEPLPTKVSRFHERPFFVIQAEAFTEAIREAIKDKAVMALPPSFAGIDQFVDSTDILSYPEAFSQFRQLY